MGEGGGGIGTDIYANVFPLLSVTVSAYTSPLQSKACNEPIYCRMLNLQNIYTFQSGEFYHCNNNHNTWRKLERDTLDFIRSVLNFVWFTFDYKCKSNKIEHRQRMFKIVPNLSNNEICSFEQTTCFPRQLFTWQGFISCLDYFLASTKTSQNITIKWKTCAFVLIMVQFFVLLRKIIINVKWPDWRFVVNMRAERRWIFHSLS